jgi:hypothetical protein
MAVKRSLARALTASAFAVASVAGLATVEASPAFAFTPCTLSIGPVRSGDLHDVAVSCPLGYTHISFSLWGEDTFSDEFRQNFAFDSGGGNVSAFSVPGSVLNEDDSIFDREDEIFARVGGVDAFGQSFSFERTNSVKGRF